MRLIQEFIFLNNNFELYTKKKKLNRQELIVQYRKISTQLHFA